MSSWRQLWMFGAILAWLSLPACSALRIPTSPPGGASWEEQLVEARSLPIRRRQYFYLVQGHGDPPEWLMSVANRDDSDALFLDYTRTEGDTTVGQVGIVQGKNTTWTSGRNVLYSRALNRSRSQRWRHEYLIFADADTGLQAGLVDTFHGRLTAVQPAVAGVGKRCSFEGISDPRPCSGNIDANFNAFHATAATIFLPYDAHFDGVTWWASQAFMVAMFVAAAPDYVVEWNDLLPFATANIHAEYPRGFAKIRRRFFKHLLQKVQPCLQNKLVSMKPYILDLNSGYGTDCHLCPLSHACWDSAECEGQQERPLRDYEQLITCKP